MLFGRKQLIEWMYQQEMYGKDRLLYHKRDNIIMYKISGWQCVFEANIVLVNRENKNIIKEERWYIIMGFDLINRKFYRATQYYDEYLFNREIRQLQKRFPNARQITKEQHQEL